MKTLFCAIFLFPIALAAQENVKITGIIKNLPTGTSVIVTDVNRPTDTLMKTVSSPGGQFALKGTLPEAGPVNIQFGSQQTVYTTFLSSSTIKMTGDAKAIKNAKLVGSQTALDFSTFQKTFDPLFAKLTSYRQKMQMGNQSDSVVQGLNKTTADIHKAIDAFINKRRSSPVSAFLVAITMQLNEDYRATETRILKLKPSALNNMYAKYVQDFVAENKLTAIGSVAADFTQADTAGVGVSLSSFRGKYVLIDFWASWCGPCRQENPNVVANFQKFSPKNFTVLGVSLDRQGQKSRWMQAIYQDNLTWTHVSDLQFWDNAEAKQYKIQSIPQNFLIGPDGRILAKNLRGPDLEKKLCEVLGCN